MKQDSSSTPSRHGRTSHPRDAVRQILPVSPTLLLHRFLALRPSRISSPSSPSPNPWAPHLSVPISCPSRARKFEPRPKNAQTKYTAELFESIGKMKPLLPQRIEHNFRSRSTTIWRYFDKLIELCQSNMMYDTATSATIDCAPTTDEINSLSIAFPPDDATVR